MAKTRSFKDLSEPILPDPDRRERVRRHRVEAIDEILAYQLDELRRARHITQEELAAALGVRQPSVSRLEHGDDPNARGISTCRCREVVG